MKHPENNKWLDEVLAEAICSEKSKHNFEKWQQEHPEAVEMLTSRAGRKPSASPGPLTIRRLIMKSPITKLAAAAVILVGMGLGGLLFRSTSQITWADVIEQMRNVKRVTYFLIEQSADPSSESPDSFRTDDRGRIFIEDPAQAMWLWEGFMRFTAEQVRRVGTEQLDGVETVLFAAPINVVVGSTTPQIPSAKSAAPIREVGSVTSFTGRARVWVDSQSAIPLRLIIKYTDDKGVHHRTILEDIRWEVTDGE